MIYLLHLPLFLQRQRHRSNESPSPDGSLSKVKERQIHNHPGMYSESIALYLGFLDPDSVVFEETVIGVPADGEIAFVAKRDLRAGTAKFLTLDNYANQTVLLSGGAYTLAETAEIKGKVVNNRVVAKIIPRGN